MALNTCFLYHCKSPHTSKHILIEYINTSYEVEAAQSRFDVKVKHIVSNKKYEWEQERQESKVMKAEADEVGKEEGPGCT